MCLNVNGGTVGSATLNNNSVLNLSGGTVTNLSTNAGTTTNISGSGVVTNTSGNGAVNYMGNPTVTLNLPNPIITSQPVTFTNVSVPSITAQSSTVVVNNPQTVVVNSVQLQNNSIIALVNGTINTVTANGSSRMTLMQGVVNNVILNDLSTLTTHPGGTLPLVTANDNATANYFVQSSLAPGQEIPAGASSGSGTLEYVDLLGHSSLNVYSDSNLQLSPLGPGSDRNGPYNGYAIFLVGPGSSLTDTDIRVQEYDGLSPGNPNLGLANTGNVDFLPVLVPEPTTLSLVAAAVLAGR
jgi:hypothetical protein